MAPRSCALAQRGETAPAIAPIAALLTRRAFLGVAAATACAGASLLAGCGSGGASGAAAPVDIPCPYDWANLRWEEGRPVYYEGDQARSRWGVDVSEHQRAVDWEAVAGAGAQFAFVRIGNRGATEGKLDVDEFFFQNVDGATRVGVPLSAYFFSQSVNEDEAREEAAFAIEQLRVAMEQGASFQFVAYDHEPVDIEGARANDLPAEQFAANARAFCDTVAEAGFEPMVYGNQSDLGRLTVEERRAWPLWLAEYGVEAPTAPYAFALWQYTNKGTVPGIDTDADLNIWFETR